MDFDVSEEALVSLVSLRNNKLHILFNSTQPADKIQLAMGDGRYRLHAKGEGLLLSTAEQPMHELSSWIQVANESDNPLEVLAQTIQQAHPDQDIAFHLSK